MKKSLYELLSEGETALGTHVSLTESAITELLGDVGFDYLWIDMEHTANSLERVQNHLIAARAAGVSAVVRIPSNNPVLAKPVLEMGPDGIVFPQVNSYQEALDVVKACSYPPLGIRGFGPRRAIRYGLDQFDLYRDSINQQLLKLVQIEHIKAYQDLDRILSIEELDTFILGPCDLASSMGHLGDWSHPEVERVIDEVFRKIHQAGKRIGVSFGDYSLATCEVWKNRGANLISLGADTDYLINGAKQALGNLKKTFR